MINFWKEFFFLTWQYFFGFTVGFMIARSCPHFPWYLAVCYTFLGALIPHSCIRYKYFLRRRKIGRILEDARKSL